MSEQVGSGVPEPCPDSGYGNQPRWPRGSSGSAPRLLPLRRGPLASQPFVLSRLRLGSMSRIPPSLLYLTIYNPTLKPALLEPDDEDAEEQAHILFYTAREHAVSRDRILRQVGLARALVNFSE